MIFAPIDQQGPDARRKQLIGKLMQQAQQQTAANAQTANTARTGGAAFAGSGAPFHGVDNAARAFRPQTTQSSNILPSILAKLGGGLNAPQKGEVSPGRGIAITDPASVIAALHTAAPEARGLASNPIPVPGAPQQNLPAAAPIQAVPSMPNLTVSAPTNGPVGDV